MDISSIIVREKERNNMTPKKVLLVIVGCISLVIGGIGVVMPFLPSFPFLLLTAICFGSSSERLNAWFKSTPMYRVHLQAYLNGGGMTMKAKISVMVTITLLMGFGFYMMGAVPVGRAILAVVWLAHMLYFIFRVKTIKAQ